MKVTKMRNGYARISAYGMNQRATEIAAAKRSVFACGRAPAANRYFITSLNAICHQHVPSSFGPHVIARFTAGFQLQTDVRDRHRLVERFAHVIDRQRGDRDRSEGLHLDSSLGFS